MCDDWARSGWYVKQTASSSGIRCCANCKNYTLARECEKIKVSMKNHSIMGGKIFDSDWLGNDILLEPIDAELDEHPNVFFSPDFCCKYHED